MLIRAQVITGVRWTAGARLAAQVITWAITLIVIRMLSPADYGLLAMATVFIALLSMVSEFGLGPAVVQSAELKTDTLRKIFGVVLAVDFGLAAILLAAAPVIADLFREPRLVRIVSVLSLQFVITAFAVIPDALLQRRMEFRKRSLLDLCGAVVGSAATLTLAYAGQGVWALVAGTLFSQSFKAVGVNVLAPFAYWPRFSLSGLRSIARFGWHVTASQIAWFFFAQADMAIAGRWLGKELLGFYSVAMHIASLPNQRIAGIINQVAFPAFALMQDDRQKVRRNLLLGIRILSIVAFPVLWGISSVAPELVRAALGAKWVPSTLPLQLVGLVMPLRMINSFVPNAVQGIGRSDILLKNAILASLIAPTAIFIGVQWGLMGLSVAWLVAIPLVFVQNMVRSLPAIGLGWRELGRAMLPSAAAGLTMYGAVAVARVAVVPDETGGLKLALLIVVGVAAYVLGSLAFNRRGALELIGLVRDVVFVRRSRADEPGSLEPPVSNR